MKKILNVKFISQSDTGVRWYDLDGNTFGVPSNCYKGDILADDGSVLDCIDAESIGTKDAIKLAIQYFESASMEQYLKDNGFTCRIYGIGLWAQTAGGVVVDMNSGNATVCPFIDADSSDGFEYASNADELAVVLGKLACIKINNVVNVDEFEKLVEDFETDPSVVDAIEGFEVQFEVTARNKDGESKDFTIVYQSEDRNDKMKAYSGYEVKPATMYGYDTDQSEELVEFMGGHDWSCLNGLAQEAKHLSKEALQGLLDAK